jgi:hypothetical protein
LVRGELLAHLVALGPRLFQGDGRIGAKGKELVLVIEAVSKSPPFTPGWDHLEKKASAIEQLDRFDAGLGVADRGISKCH